MKTFHREFASTMITLCKREAFIRVLLSSRFSCFLFFTFSEAKNLFTSYANTFECLQVCLHNGDNSASFIKKYIHGGAKVYKDVLCDKTKQAGEIHEAAGKLRGVGVQSLRALLSLHSPALPLSR